MQVLFRGRHVFMGYLGMEEKTKETIDDEGWLHSGDIGRLDQVGCIEEGMYVCMSLHRTVSCTLPVALRVRSEQVHYISIVSVVYACRADHNSWWRKCSSCVR